MNQNSGKEAASVKPLVRRDGVAVATDAVKGGLRVLQTASVLARTGGAWLLGRRPELPVLLRETFEQLGSTYIKLGQFIASSPSLFPEEYVEEFQKCLDDTPTLPFTHIRRVIEGELKRPLEEVYEWVDITPLASASIAQVHAARLKNGTDVVIKVQKPGVRNVLLTDFNFIYFASRVVELVVPGLSRSAVSGVIDELQGSMLEECDFIQEANNLEHFSEFLNNTGNTRVVAPKPYRQYSTSKVLTMERFFGVPLTDLDTLRQHVDDPAEALITALNTWFTSLMMCDFFHADLHAGNLMLLEDGRVGFIDFGMVGRIRKNMWHSMSNFLEGIGQGDISQVAHAMAEIGMTKETVDIAALTKDIEALQERLGVVDPTSLLEGDRNDKEVNRLIMDLISIGEGHGIRFPREFALLLKQFLYFDRYVQALAPEMDMFSDDRVDMWGAMDDVAGLLLGEEE